MLVERLLNMTGPANLKNLWLKLIWSFQTHWWGKSGIITLNAGGIIIALFYTAYISNNVHFYDPAHTYGANDVNALFNKIC